MNRRNTKRHFRPAVIETLEHRLALSVTPEPSAAIAVTQLDAPELPELDIRVSTQADLDGNGSPDLLVGTGTGLSVFFDIDSSDQPPIRIDYASSAVQSIEVADINGDLVEDVVVGTEFEVLVYVNNGNTAGGTWAGLGVPSGVAAEGGFAHVADVTGDDIADLIVDLNVRFDVLAGLGDGEFGEPISFAQSTADLPRAFALGDVDGDGAIDVAAYDFSVGALQIWANDGGGIYENIIHSIELPFTRVVELEDTNGDGVLDLLLGKFNLIEDRSGFGDGTFSEPTLARVSASGITHIRAADFDDDGTVDLVVGHDGLLHDSILGNVDGGISLIRGDASGGYLPAVRIASGSWSAVVVDDTLNQVGAMAPGLFDLYQIETETKFSIAPEIFELEGRVAKNTSVFVDVNSDGFLDVVATKIGFVPDNSLSLFLADGEGGFTISDEVMLDFAPLHVLELETDDGTVAIVGRGTDGTTFVATVGTSETGKLNISGPSSVTLVDADVKSADLNADGLPDFLIRETDFSFRVWLGAEGGLVEGEQIFFSDVLLEERIADVNNDGSLDIVLLTAPDPEALAVSRLSIHSGSGDGGFAISSAVPTTSSTFDIADVRGDGRMSLLIPTQSTVFALSFNDGFSVEFSVSSPGQLTFLGAVDVNGDERVDIVMADADGEFAVALGEENGIAAADGHELLHQVDEVLISDFDGDGKMDVMAIGFGVNRGQTANFFNTGSTEASMSLLSGSADAFSSPVRYVVSLKNPTDVMLNDIDADGDTDVLFASEQGFLTWQYGSVLGDLNGDSRVNVLDIDLLCEAIRSNPENIEPFDFTADGALDSADLDYLVEDTIGTRGGDTDLDGRVDFADFLQFAANFGDEVATWSEGDFSGDGKVNFQDFIILATNFGFER